MFTNALLALALLAPQGFDQEEIISLPYDCESTDGVVTFDRSDEPLDRMVVLACVGGNCAGGVDLWPLFREQVPLVLDDVEVLQRFEFTEPDFLNQFEGGGPISLAYQRFGIPGQGFCVGARIYVRYWYEQQPITSDTSPRYLTGYSHPFVREHGEAYLRGRRLEGVFEKFDDDQFDPIVAVRLSGRLSNSAFGTITNRTNETIVIDPMSVRMYSSARIRANDQIVTGVGRQYGNGPITLGAGSTYAYEYGPVIDTYPRFLPDGSPLQWETDRIWPFVKGYQPGEFVDVDLKWIQRWENDLYGHALAFDYEFGVGDVDLEFQAIHASGRIQ